MNQNIVIVRYNGGNVQSVLFALERLGVQAIVSDCAAQIRAADKVIFPGVGAAGAVMPYLQAQGLDRLICSLRQPVLGICLGMQLMCAASEEGDTQGMGIFPEGVKRFPGSVGRIPQTGWKPVSGLSSSLFDGIAAGTYFYFVHSYYVPEGRYMIARSAAGALGYSAALQRENFYGVQFHPERSGPSGARLLRNFIQL